MKTSLIKLNKDYKVLHHLLDKTRVSYILVFYMICCYKAHCLKTKIYSCFILFCEKHFIKTRVVEVYSEIYSKECEFVLNNFIVI